MKRLLQIVVGVFAAIGVAYVGLIVYTNVALPSCTLLASSEAASPDGKYFAIFEQTRCEDPSRSRATVSMGLNENRRERIVWMKVTGTTDVRLTWNGSRELLVTLPRAAEVKKYGPYDGWPRAERRDLESRDAT